MRVDIPGTPSLDTFGDARPVPVSSGLQERRSGLVPKPCDPRMGLSGPTPKATTRMLPEVSQGSTAMPAAGAHSIDALGRAARAL